MSREVFLRGERPRDGSKVARRLLRSRCVRLVLSLLVVASAVRPADALTDPGFPPLRTSGRDAGGTLRVDAGGHSWTFAPGPLPARIAIDGHELLAEPPPFVVRTAGGETTLAFSPSGKLQADPDTVSFASIARVGALRVGATTTLERDGMVRVDVALRSDEPVRVRGFRYALVIPEEEAKQYAHHLPYDYRRERVDRDALFSSLGRVPNASTPFPFVPSFMIGGPDRGLEWWCETDAGFRPLRSKPLHLVRDGAVVRLEVAPLATERLVTPEQPWMHTFAVFALPARSPDPDWRAFRFTDPSSAQKLDPPATTRTEWIAFPGQFDAEYHGLPASRDTPRQRKLRARLARLGVGYVPYAKLSSVPSMNPVALRKASLWAASDRRFTGPGGAEARFMRERQGREPGTPYGYAACLGDDGYLDWLLGQVLQTFDRESPAGLYFDWGAMEEACLNDPRVKSGEATQVWNYFRVRDFYRRLRREVRARRPDAFVTAHDHGQPRALAAHLDFQFVGETLNFVFRGGHSFPEVRRRPQLYRPDYEGLPAGLLEALMEPPGGGVNVLLPQIDRNALGKRPDAPGETRALVGLALARDFPLWWTNLDPGTAIDVMRALDRFGTLVGARVLPWPASSADFPHPVLRVGAYRQATRTLLVVWNPSDRSLARTALSLRPGALGLPPSLRVRDLEGRPLPDDAWQPATGTLRLNVPARDFRLLVLEPSA